MKKFIQCPRCDKKYILFKRRRCEQCGFIVFPLGMDAYIDSFYRKVFEFKTKKYIVLCEVMLKHKQKRTTIISKTKSLGTVRWPDRTLPDAINVDVFRKILSNIHISPKATDEDIEKLLVLA